MGFSFTNICRSTYLRYGLRAIIYFSPVLYFQYLSDVDTMDQRIFIPPIFVYIFTYIHQLVLTSPAILFRFPYAIDLSLTTLEAAAYIALWRCSRSGSSPDLALLSLTVFHLINSVVLFLMGFLKISDIIYNGSGLLDFHAKYDYLTGCPWKPRNLKEEHSIPKFSFSRAMVTLMVYFTIGSAWNTIILAPIRETASIPLRTTKSLHVPSNNLKTGTPDVWNVIIGRPTVVGSDMISNPSLESAVETILLSNGSNSNSKTPCPLVTSWQTPNLPSKDLFTAMPMTLDARAFRCPYKSDLLITVNFTKLGIVVPSASFSAADSDGVRHSVVQVMLGGGADDLSDIIRRAAVPILLIPGVNLLGFAKMYILQKFKKPSLSMLGVFGSYESFLVPEIVNLSSDPQAQTVASGATSSPPPLILHSPDIATIRIIPFIDLADWQIIQEYRDRSVLKGFSTVGGLWTFLGGVYAFLFGKSIAFILFNIKPLSIFGLIHQFQKEHVKSHYQKEYNGIERDIEQGFNSFMVDHFVDLNLIKSQQQPPTDSPDALPLEELSRGAQPIAIVHHDPNSLAIPTQVPGVSSQPFISTVSTSSTATLHARDITQQRRSTEAENPPSDNSEIGRPSRT